MEVYYLVALISRFVLCLAVKSRPRESANTLNSQLPLQVYYKLDIACILFVYASSMFTYLCLRNTLAYILSSLTGTCYWNSFLTYIAHGYSLLLIKIANK